MDGLDEGVVQVKRERIFLTPAQAAHRYQLSVAFFYGRGGCKKPLRGVLRLGKHIRVDPELFERGPLDGEVDHGSESKAKPLQPGDYRCLGCGWTGHVGRAVLREDLRCPRCGIRGDVERLEG